MSKKRVQFSEEGLSAEDRELLRSAEEDAGPSESDSAPAGSGPHESRLAKGKHTLDSDEEDDTGDKYNIMQDDDIEGQEDATVDFDEGIKITPFNMQDELEEGHFDSEGTFIFNKDKGIKDEWMDNIDWVKVKHMEKGDVKVGAAETGLGDSSSDEETEAFDEIATYKQMVPLMKPGETVVKALRRLGGGKAGISAASASQRWKAKRAKVKEGLETNEEDEEKAAEEVKQKADMLQLTGMADRLLQHGNTEIYQHSFEKITFLIKTTEEKLAATRTSIPEGTDDDSALDMFADDLDNKRSDSGNASSSTEKAKVENGGERTSAASKSKGTPVLNEVYWEYKWENKEDEEVHGPFSSSEMAQWVEDNYFPNGVFVRKKGTEDGAFYSSRRIDFDLYT